MNELQVDQAAVRLLPLQAVALHSPKVATWVGLFAYLLRGAELLVSNHHSVASL
jgi:hypothetical protein